VVKRHSSKTQDASQDPVVLVGTVPCKILHEPYADGRHSIGLIYTSHASSVTGRGEEVNSKRQRVWSCAGREIVGLGFSDASVLVWKRQAHDKGRMIDIIGTSDMGKHQAHANVHPAQ
jgi:hypothetical protein